MDEIFSFQIANCPDALTQQKYVKNALHLIFYKAFKNRWRITRGVKQRWYVKKELKKHFGGAWCAGKIYMMRWRVEKNLTRTRSAFHIIYMLQ